MQFHARQLIRRIEAGPVAIDEWKQAALNAGCNRTAVVSAAAVAKLLASWLGQLGGDVNDPKQ